MKRSYTRIFLSFSYDDTLNQKFVNEYWFIIRWLRFGIRTRDRPILSTKILSFEYQITVARVCRWLMRPWIRIPLTAIFGDIPRGWFKIIWNSVFCFRIWYGGLSRLLKVEIDQFYRPIFYFFFWISTDTRISTDSLVCFSTT